MQLYSPKTGTRTHFHGQCFGTSDENIDSERFCSVDFGDDRLRQRVDSDVYSGGQVQHERRVPPFPPLA